MFTNARNITVNGGNFTTVENIYSSEPGKTLPCLVKDELRTQSNHPEAFLNLCKASALGATHDSQDHISLPETSSHSGVQSQILQAALECMSSTSSYSKPVLHLHGPSKTLNSTIASSIVETFGKRGELAGSFFFNSQRPKCSSINYFTPTLALQLALSIPGFQAGLVKSMHDDPLICQRALPDQVEALILEPLRKLDVRGPFLVIIDALDDCKGKEKQLDILTQLLRLVHVQRSPLRFIIVSSSTDYLRCLFDEARFRSISASLSIRNQDVPSQLSLLSHSTIFSIAHLQPVFF